MISISVFICWLLYFTSFTEGRRFRFDYSYQPVAKGWFKLHQIPANWHEARLRCDHEGAVLASPLDEKFLKVMKAMMSSNKISNGVFSGIHATVSRGDYFSMEGVPLVKIPISWAPYEPDNYENNENCLVLHFNGTMSDVKCTETFSYICYKNETTFFMTECGTPDTEYKLDKRTGSCYKVHTVGQPWSRAFMTCAAEGGYLSIINSDEEAKVLVDIFAKYPKSVISSAVDRDIASIGYYDWGERGSWRTIHGSTLEAAGYNKWQSGRPDNLTTGEFCGSIYRTSLLNDIWCHENIAFICEKRPGSLIDEEDVKK